MGLGYCQEARKLLENYGLAVHELVELHQEQFESVIGGDLDSMRFDDLIHMANERKHESEICVLAPSGDSRLLKPHDGHEQKVNAQATTPIAKLQPGLYSDSLRAADSFRTSLMGTDTC